MKCVRGRELKILQNFAGYFIGALDYDPYFRSDIKGNCRISKYYTNRSGAASALKNNKFYESFPENNMCSGSKCCIKSKDQNYESN